MKNINDILCVYTQGFASLEQTNKDLKTADASFHLDPSKNELTPEEIAEMERAQAELPETEEDPTDARMTEIEAALMELAWMIGGGA